MKCQHCDKDVPLPFKCPFCNQYYCTEHRLPENHACPEYWRTKIPREETPPIIIEKEPQRTPYEYTPPHTLRPPPKVLWFSLTELKHLALGTLLVMSVGLSIILQMVNLRYASLEILLSLAAVFTSAFLLHELSHKTMAQHYGLWAEFRLTLFGALITLLSLVSPIKVISPGAVMIAGLMDRETVGKTALAGPLTNVVLSVMFIVFALYQSSLLFWIVMTVSAAFNAWIALFNLVPLGMLDGSKVFGWNKVVWGVAFVASIALAVFTFNELRWT